MTRREDVEGIVRGEFLDESGSAIEVRKITSGRGRVSGGDGPARPAFEDESRGRTAANPEPEPVVAESGRLGWRLRIPGGRPLATPAVTGGRVFLGGGFGSHEFYAFSAADGRTLWRIQTGDDGPTAATVAGDHVAFNTESCTVYVVEVFVGTAEGTLYAFETDEGESGSWTMWGGGPGHNG